MSSHQRSIAPIDFGGPAGRIVGLLHRPAAAPRFLAVVSHPHPLYGGTMDNKVTYRAARALDDAGGLVLRYNFRGVRGSEGEHDDGRGEQDDLRAAIAHLRGRAAEIAPGASLPLMLAGFSFGSAVSARVACSGETELAGLLLIGAPMLRYRFEELSRRPAGLPVACIQGGCDEHGPLPELEHVWDGVPEPKRLIVVPSAGHFFDDEQQLFDAVRLVARETFGLGG